MIKTNCQYCNDEMELSQEEFDSQELHFCSVDCCQLFYGGGFDDRKDFLLDKHYYI
jgi:hypothetical protein